MVLSVAKAKQHGNLPSGHLAFISLQHKPLKFGNHKARRILPPSSASISSSSPTKDYALHLDNCEDLGTSSVLLGISGYRLLSVKSMASEPKESPSNNPGLLSAAPDEATKGYFMQQTVCPP
ncbi:hypothetical protein Dimus_009908 [Dionaea muscipula]